MSTYQGTCGHCDPSGGCCPAPVLPSYESAYTAAQTTEMRSAAIVYAEAARVKQAGNTLQFASHSDYMKYKRARAIAGGASRNPCRPPQAAVIAQIEAIGCPVPAPAPAPVECDTVCPITEETMPFLTTVDISE
jgi:hypothetical protein